VVTALGGILVKGALEEIQSLLDLALELFLRKWRSSDCWLISMRIYTHTLGDQNQPVKRQKLKIDENEGLRAKLLPQKDLGCFAIPSTLHSSATEDGPNPGPRWSCANQPSMPSVAWLPSRIPMPLHRGARPNPCWLRSLLDQECQVYAASTPTPPATPWPTP